MREKARRWAQILATVIILSLLVFLAPTLFVYGYLFFSLPGLVGAFLMILCVVALLLIFVSPVFQFLMLPLRHRAKHPVKEAHEAIHRKLFVVDLHADTLMFRRNLLQGSSFGHADLPRLQAGGVGLQVFATPTKAPVGMNLDCTPDCPINMNDVLAIIQGWPRKTWFSMENRALHMAQRLEKLATQSEGLFRVIHTAQDLAQYRDARSKNPSYCAGLLAIEGLYCLHGSLEKLDTLFNAGFRIAGPTHFCDNEIGGSAHGKVKMGLQDFGRELIPYLEQKGMILDLAHASPKLIDGVLEVAQCPLMISHTGLQGGYANARNLADAQAKSLADAGGLIGIGFWGDAVGPGGLDAVLKMLLYALEVVGEDHVALGSDFDGMVPEPFDASGYPYITDALLSAGLSESSTAKILGKNAYRFLSARLPSA